LVSGDPASFHDLLNTPSKNKASRPSRGDIPPTAPSKESSFYHQTGTTILPETRKHTSSNLETLSPLTKKESNRSGVAAAPLKSQKSQTSKLVNKFLSYQTVKAKPKKIPALKI
jgi:hypothetical protein